MKRLVRAAGVHGQLYAKLGQASDRTASITERLPAVGTVRASRRRACAKSAAKSSSVRSRPPAITSMLRSENFPSAPWFGGARIRSITSSRACDAIAARQTWRISIASSSCQSWRISLRTYASQSAGTDSKKLPPTTSTRSATRLENRGGAGHDVRLVKEHTACIRMGSENRSEQSAVATADVDNLVEAAEIERLENAWCEAAVADRHRAVEDRTLRRSLRPPFPDIHAVERAEGVLASADAVLEVAPGLPQVRPAHQKHPPAQRPGHIATQRLAERCQCEATSVVLLDDADRSQRSEEPIKGLRIGTRLARRIRRSAAAPRPAGRGSRGWRQRRSPGSTGSPTRATSDQGSCGRPETSSQYVRALRMGIGSARPGPQMDVSAMSPQPSSVVPVSVRARTVRAAAKLDLAVRRPPPR